MEKMEGTSRYCSKREKVICVLVLSVAVILAAWIIGHGTVERSIKIALCLEDSQWSDVRQANIEVVDTDLQLYKSTVNGQEQLWFIDSWPMSMGDYISVKPFSTEAEVLRFTKELTYQEMMLACLRHELASEDYMSVLDRYEQMPKEKLRERYYQYFYIAAYDKE